MLTHIHIRHLAIVDEIDVELASGMTALTGETGAGKSILVDALGLVLGDRADSGVIRHGAERAEISASFDIKDNSVAVEWLAARDLDLDGECQLRRIISREGRSRGYINGQPVPMQSLREIGECLVDIHGQHEHQSLLKKPVQRQLLDGFGKHAATLEKTAALYSRWKDVRDMLEKINRDDAERDARLDLLRFQLQELEALQLTTDEINSINEEHGRQANAGRLLEACQRALQVLDDDEQHAAYSLLARMQDELGELAALDPSLNEPVSLLNEASVNLQEAIESIRDYADKLDIDPQRLQWLEERIGLLHDLSRKHRCRPEELPAIRQSLAEELAALENADQARADLDAELAALEEDYLASASKLTAARKKAARNFGKAITEAMQTLGMAGGTFEAAVSAAENSYSRHGQDDITFRVTANRGQPLQPLAKVASGGELSRISLSIQVISAGSETIPTLIFDEVDSGIGGGVAEIVGQKLRTLGDGRQVLCVTHLPQVAALAHQQLQVSKLSGDDTTRTRARRLDQEERIDELARMLGGVKITKQTREHAREMLEQGQKDAPQKVNKRRIKGVGDT